MSLIRSSGSRGFLAMCCALTTVSLSSITAASPAKEAIGATAMPRTSQPAAMPASAPSGPAAVKVFACDIHDCDEAAALPAITLVGARNGGFNGKAVAECSGAVQGLKANVSDLKGPAGMIAAAQVTIRYGIEWDSSFRNRYRPRGRDILLERAPETPAGKVAVWLTVQVPKDAKAGSYAGELTVEAKGVPAAKVPVKLDVADWTLPAPQDYRTIIDIIESPDTLSMEYAVPLWSPKHWEMIAQSMRLLSPTGERFLYLPLLCQTNQGNEQSMVRWIKKGENQYDYDFTVFDKYLETAEKELGRPKFVVIYVWDVLLTTPSGRYTDVGADDSPYQKGEKERLRARAEQAKKGIPVTCLDPATGKCETINVPGYADPASKALWAPVWKGVKERLAKHGLEKAAMLGSLSDWRPTKEEFATLAELSGNMKWVSTSHHLREAAATTDDFGKPRDGGVIGLASIALDFDVVANPEKGRKLGWQLPRLQLFNWQCQRSYFNQCSMAAARGMVEQTITGGQRGMGRIGGDFWQCCKTKAGSRVGIVTDRYPQAYWHSMDIGDSVVGPGPAGPEGTARLEVLREGMQECEARIAIESTLADPARKAKLGDDLAKRAQTILDEKLKALWKAQGADDEDLTVNDFRAKVWDFWLKKWNKAKGSDWFLASGWQKRSAELFAVAGEVEGRLGR